MFMFNHIIYVQYSILRQSPQKLTNYVNFSGSTFYKQSFQAPNQQCHTTCNDVDMPNYILGLYLVVSNISMAGVEYSNCIGLQ